MRPHQRSGSQHHKLVSRAALALVQASIQRPHSSVPLHEACCVLQGLPWCGQGWQAHVKLDLWCTKSRQT
jgi:hypothetical protein